MKRILIACMLFGTFAALTTRAQQVPLFTADFPPEEFARRRAQMYDAIGPNAVAFLQGAPAPSGYVRFRQTNEFYYLCGVEVPHAYVILDGFTRRATLFLPHRNEPRERFEGKTLSAEDADTLVKLSGIDAVAPVDAIGERFSQYARGTSIRTVYTLLSPAEGFAMSRDLASRSIADKANDPWDGAPSREGRLVEMLHKRFPVFEVRDLTPALDNARVIKSPREIELIKKATVLSGQALIEGMKSTKPGMMEYELDGMAKFIYYRNGAQGEAYFSLIASGQNAWYPHYNAGKKRMEDGELLLMDFAPDVGYYMSDLTRMWPVNGKFSDEQRELYDFYVTCYKSILKAIRPGVTAAVILRDAVHDMETAVSKARFSKPVYEKAAKEFIAAEQRQSNNPNAVLGHWVGMATHDDGPHEGPLRAGMVLTIEPALRVPEEKLYIRLEDLIVITANGKEVVSEFVPSEIDQIEKTMQESGLLKTYPGAFGR